MAATAFHDPVHDQSLPKRDRRGFFRRLVEAMVEARAAQAQAEVSAYLMTLDDSTLAKYGVDRVMTHSSPTRTRAF